MLIVHDGGLTEERPLVHHSFGERRGEWGRREGRSAERRRPYGRSSGAANP